MPTPTRPVNYLNWTVSGGTMTQPPSSQCISGWTYLEAPPCEYLNYIDNLFDAWVQWLDFYSQRNSQPFDATVGSNLYCNYTSLAAALAAASAGWRILVVDSANPINTPVAITLANIEIVCKPGVILSSTLSADLFHVNADGFRFSGGKVTGFGNAFLVDSVAGTHCLVRDVWMTGNTTDFNDAGANVTSYGIMT